MIFRVLGREIAACVLSSIYVDIYFTDYLRIELPQKPTAANQGVSN